MNTNHIIETTFYRLNMELNNKINNIQTDFYKHEIERQQTIAINKTQQLSRAGNPFNKGQ